MYHPGLPERTCLKQQSKRTLKKLHFFKQKNRYKKTFCSIFPSQMKKEQENKKNHTAPIKVIYIQVLNSGTTKLPALNLWVQ